MCTVYVCVIRYPSKVQHILQHEADSGAGLSLLYDLLHLIEVLVHTRLRVEDSSVNLSFTIVQV